MERTALKIFKEFALEFVIVPSFNENTARAWFHGRNYNVLFSRSVFYDFMNVLNFTKEDLGINTISLSHKSLKELFFYDEKYLQKLNSTIEKEKGAKK